MTTSYTIKQLFRNMPAQDLENVRVNGWVRTARESKNFAFVELNDGSFFKNIQVVLEENNLPNYREIMKEVGVGAALNVQGKLVLTPGMKQPFEIKAEAVEIVGESPSDYPLQKKRHSVEFLRSISHLRPRANLFQCAFRVRSVVSQAIHRFMHERDFTYVHTPLITTSDAEGAGEMFHVTTLDLDNPPHSQEGKVDYSQDFFGKPVYLTVSGQLNAEALAMAFRNVYTFGPTFRAENSYTPRHAAEFWMVEPEIAFADLADDMQLQEDMVKYLIRAVLDELPEEMEFLDSFVSKGLIDRLSAVYEADFARVSYTEAVELLKKSGKEFEYPVFWGCDLQTEHERYLAEEYFKGPVFVTDYPKEIKSFYMRLNDDGKTVAASDLMVPGIGELCGGSQREERHDVLVERMNELGIGLENYHWYLELRKFGTVPHAGFGMGLDRFIMYLTGVSNIRDVLPFPRTPKSAEF